MAVSKHWVWAQDKINRMLAITLATLAIFLLLISSTFFSAVPRIEGNQHLSEEEVLSLAGLSPPVNLLLFSPRQAMAGLHNSPWIKEVIIRRRWPNQLIIHLEERVPALRVRVQNQVFLLDREGLILARQEEDNEEVPLLIPEKVVLVGSPGSRLTLPEVQGVLAALNQIVQGSEIEVIDLGARPLPILRWRDGETVILGRWAGPEELAARIVLAASLHVKGRGPGVTVDLSNPAVPLVRRESR